MLLHEMISAKLPKKDIVKKALEVYTGGCPKQAFWRLTGNHMAGARAAIMTILCDKQMPQSKSGITALREKLFELYEIAPDCIAQMEDDLFVSMGY